jgi:hypothetical protein
MNVHFAVADIFQNAGVGRRLAARIVVFGQSIDGDGNPIPPQSHPFHWDGDNPAGHHHSKNILLAERRQYPAKFAMSDHGLATYQRNMERPVFFHQTQNSRYQRVTAQVRKFGQLLFAAQMGIAVGVTSWAAQWTLAGNFDR